MLQAFGKKRWNGGTVERIGCVDVVVLWRLVASSSSVVALYGVRRIRRTVERSNVPTFHDVKHYSRT